jgi:hypothetical protein
MDALQAIKLVELWLMADNSSQRYSHLQIIDEKLASNEDLTFKYLSTLLTEKESLIQEEHQKLIIEGANSGSNNSSQNLYQRYKELILRFVKVLLNSIGEKRYRGMLADFVKKKYVPIEESSKII